MESPSEGRWGEFSPGGIVATEKVPDGTITAENAAIAKHDARLAMAQRRLIAERGEAGWGSPFYIGSPSAVPAEDASQYSKWKAARDNWTYTGDPKFLEAVREHSDLDCPPEKVAKQPSLSKQAADFAWGMLGLPPTIVAGAFFLFVCLVVLALWP